MLTPSTLERNLSSSVPRVPLFLEPKDQRRRLHRQKASKSALAHKICRACSVCISDECTSRAVSIKVYLIKTNRRTIYVPAWSRSRRAVHSSSSSLATGATKCGETEARTTFDTTA